MLAAGFPNTTSGSSLNRFCSSGLKAVQDIANQIAVGAIECGVAMGAESMTAGGDRLERPFIDEILENPESRDCMQPMGQTSENVGKDFNISRERQDRYAAESYRRAEVAQKAGWFDDEISPIKTTIKDPRPARRRRSSSQGTRASAPAPHLSRCRRLSLLSCPTVTGRTPATPRN